MIRAELPITASIHPNICADTTACKVRAQNAPIFILGKRLPLLSFFSEEETIILSFSNHFEIHMIGCDGLLRLHSIFAVFASDKPNHTFSICELNNTPELKIIVL